MSSTSETPTTSSTVHKANTTSEQGGADPNKLCNDTEKCELARNGVHIGARLKVLWLLSYDEVPAQSANDESTTDTSTTTTPENDTTVEASAQQSEDVAIWWPCTLARCEGAPRSNADGVPLSQLHYDAHESYQVSNLQAVCTHAKARQHAEG